MSGNAKAGNGGGMEVFPDLHHKMSKKIAQLTKVIYHLNTKNEDHSIEIDQINANHQIEIQQILRDAANRITKFKDAIEAKQQAVRISNLLLSLRYFQIYSLGKPGKANRKVSEKV
jgi:hypothetical protein